MTEEHLSRNYIVRQVKARWDVQSLLSSLHESEVMLTKAKIAEFLNAQCQWTCAFFLHFPLAQQANFLSSNSLPRQETHTYRLSGTGYWSFTVLLTMCLEGRSGSRKNLCFDPEWAKDNSFKSLDLLCQRQPSWETEWKELQMKLNLCTELSQAKVTVAEMVNLSTASDWNLDNMVELTKLVLHEKARQNFGSETLLCWSKLIPESQNGWGSQRARTTRIKFYRL